MSTQTTGTSIEERALELLGAGIPETQVASALGVSVSRISQLLSSEEFATAVKTLRFASLQRHAKKDNKYDDMELKLLEMLEKSVAFLYDPLKIAKILSQVNAAKRRAEMVPTDLTPTAASITLNMPAILAQNYIAQVNVNNQVVSVASATRTEASEIIDNATETVLTSEPKQHTLVTIQSTKLEALREKLRNPHGERALIESTASKAAA